MKKKFAGPVAAVLIFFLMIVTYLSLAAMIIFGTGYVLAVRNNPDTIKDYTEVSSFKKATGEYLDALYNAVSDEGVLYLPYKDSVEFFAYGLDTNRIFCSNISIYDMPTFDEVYMDSPAYIFYIKYSSGVFRGNDKATGISSSFEYVYSDAAQMLFDGQSRYYADAALILAVAVPKIGFSGFSYARMEFFLIKNGLQILFICFGLFLTASALLLWADKTRKNTHKIIAGICTWIPLEIKLFCLVLYIAKFIDWTVKGSMSSAFIWLILIGIPMVYCFCVEMRFEREAFFRTSIIAIVCGMMRELFNTVAEVNDLQIRFRRRAMALIIFGVLFPAILFILVTLLFGDLALRFCLAIYIILYTVISIYVFNRYGRLVNGVCRLTNITKCFALGERLPVFETEDPDLEPLIDNLRAYDSAVDSAASLKTRKETSRNSDIAKSVEEIKTIVGELNEKWTEKEPSSDVVTCLTRLTSLADNLQRDVLIETPVKVPVLKRMDFLAALDDVLDSKIAEFSAARLKIRPHLVEPPAYITADYSHIRAALDILVSNAILHAMSGSEVRVVLKRSEESWLFLIENPVNANSKNITSEDSAVELAAAKEYIAINGGKLVSRSGNGIVSVAIKLPAAH